MRNFPTPITKCYGVDSKTVTYETMWSMHAVPVLCNTRTAQQCSACTVHAAVVLCCPAVPCMPLLLLWVLAVSPQSKFRGQTIGVKNSPLNLASQQEPPQNGPVRGSVVAGRLNRAKWRLPVAPHAPPLPPRPPLCSLAGPCASTWQILQLARS